MQLRGVKRHRNLKDPGDTGAPPRPPTNVGQQDGYTRDTRYCHRGPAPRVGLRRGRARLGIRAFGARRGAHWRARRALHCAAEPCRRPHGGGAGRGRLPPCRGIQRRAACGEHGSAWTSLKKLEAKCGRASGTIAQSERAGLGRFAEVGRLRVGGCRRCAGCRTGCDVPLPLLSDALQLACGLANYDGTACLYACWAAAGPCGWPITAQIVAVDPTCHHHAMAALARTCNKAGGGAKPACHTLPCCHLPPELCTHTKTAPQALATHRLTHPRISNTLRAARPDSAGSEATLTVPTSCPGTTAASP